MIDANDSPFAAIGYEQAHRDGQDMAVVAIRGVFELAPDGTLSVADAQEIVLVDEYLGDPHRTPLVRPADLVPFKPAADVTLIGRAYPPGGFRTASEWCCGVRVGSHRNVIRVSGPRAWVREKRRWSVSVAEPVESVELDYRKAWTDRITPGGDTPALNPLGATPPARDGREEDVEGTSLAAIDKPDESYDDPFADRAPVGFGPVPPFWRLRQRHAGTYDDAWAAHRHPQLPADFDYRFYQCAHPDMTIDGYLRGDEEVELARLTPGGANLHFHLPGLQPVARYSWLDGRTVEQRLNLDGLHVDLRTEPYRVALTWRGWLPICPRFFKIDVALKELSDPALAAIPSATLNGVEDGRIAS